MKLHSRRGMQGLLGMLIDVGMVPGCGACSGGREKRFERANRLQGQDVRSRARKRELISTLLVNANVRYQVARKCCTSREALDATKQTQTKCQGHVARQLLTYRIDKIYLNSVGPSYVPTSALYQASCSNDIDAGAWSPWRHVGSEGMTTAQVAVNRPSP